MSDHALHSQAGPEAAGSQILDELPQRRPESDPGIELEAREVTLEPRILRVRRHLPFRDILIYPGVEFREERCIVLEHLASLNAGRGVRSPIHAIHLDVPIGVEDDLHLVAAFGDHPYK